MIDRSLLETARVAAGLTQGSLAKALGKTQPFISQVERGERDLPSDLLPRWAEACEVPPTFFLRPEGPLSESVSGMVHRRMKTLPAKPFHRANAQLQMACMQVDSLFAEVDIVPALDLPVLPASIGPEDAAATVRREWRIPEGPLPNLVALIESAGIPVLLLESFHEKHSAASQRGRWFDWLIALNADHPSSRRRFTLSHELGHIVLGHQSGAVVDDGDSARLEAEADAFASALLMPEHLAVRELRNPDLRKLIQLKQRWRVSVAFLIRRAGDLGLIDSNRRQSLYIQLSTQPGGRRREPGEFESETPTLVAQIIRSLEDDGLTLDEIADLATTHEDTLRTRYLGERPRLRAAPDRAPRAHLQLQRP
jgi:Zn-dependent peptidase ImmA (M78 family)/DNA-binding XRE family transcriptional regulator